MNSRIYYFHYRLDSVVFDALPSHTFAIRRNSAGVIEVGIAQCSPKDKFCKKTGRDIATSRLGRGDSPFSHNFFSVPSLKKFVRDFTGSNIFATHVGYVCRGLDYPS